jgi:hypothetical protein
LYKREIIAEIIAEIILKTISIGNIHVMNYRLLDVFLFKRIVPAVLWFFAIFILVTTVLSTVNQYSAVPYLDQWDGVIGFYEWWVRGDNKLNLLLVQHNEHRIALPKLFFVLDCELSSCDNRISIVTIFITQLLTIILLSYIFLKAIASWKDYFYFILPFLLMASYSWLQYENLTWGFQVQFVGVFFWSILSILGLTLAGASTSKFKRMSLVCMSVFSASLATFSMANGILVMPILILLAFFLRLSIGVHVVLLASTLFLAISYFTGYVSSSFHAHPIESVFKHPLELLSYTFSYLGSPLHEDFPEASQMIGFGYTSLAVFFVFQQLKGRQKLNDFQLTLLAIAGFILLTAIATGSGRVNFGIASSFASRYITPALIGWCCLLLLCWTYSKRMKQIAIISGIIFVLVLVKVQQRVNVYENGEIFKRDLALLSVMLGVNDSDMISRIFPRKKVVLERSKFMRSHKLSLYKYGYHDLLNKSLDTIYEGGLNEPCLGYVDIIKTGDNLEQGAFVAGWSWLPKYGQPGEYVVIADAERNVVGVALSGTYRPDVGAALNIINNKTGWQGYVTEGSSKLSTYAVLDNKICKFGNSVDFPVSTVPQ